MSASLVGSEMCIRDRSYSQRFRPTVERELESAAWRAQMPRVASSTLRWGCLLYTSDAADDM
eukprot:11255297-Alexandrium_andersonii.AAC.1